ncbi:MAG: hypothetical protein A2X64_11395 [Ignavibacteria bacterium GWF2_33_9]|nr:MAG: hypothetical protein A2X64_11395 [Ignavibacteria bacterium GWF2_33_9]
MLSSLNAEGELEKIAEIDFSSPQLMKEYNVSAFKLYSKKRKRIKDMKGTYFTQIFERNIPDISEDVLKNSYFKATSKNGKSVTFTYNEVSEKLAKIPAIVGYSERIIMRDSINIDNFEGTSLSQEQKSKFDKLFTNFSNYKIYLQMNSVSKAAADSVFVNNFLIFPMDINTDRWLGDLEKIEIYKLK